MTTASPGARTLDVLIAAHNRRELTLRCLTTLMPLLESLPDVDARVVLVDDGSTDGTGDAVRAEFPDVTIVEGNGSLYWAGGMTEAFRHASAVRDADGFLLLNDDVAIDPEPARGFIEHWLAESGADILVGQTTSLDGTSVTYSGFRETSRWRLFGFERISSLEEPMECDTFNANFVLVPGDLMRQIGGIDPAYTHGLADIDLGLTARKLGVPSVLWPTPIGACERGPDRASLLRRLPRRERARRLFVHPFGLRPDLHFARKHRPFALLPAYVLIGVAKRLAQLPPRATHSA